MELFEGVVFRYRWGRGMEIGGGWGLESEWFFGRDSIFFLVGVL